MSPTVGSNEKDYKNMIMVNMKNRHRIHFWNTLHTSKLVNQPFAKPNAWYSTKHFMKCETCNSS